jgi:hypothetical protein
MRASTASSRAQARPEDLRLLSFAYRRVISRVDAITFFADETLNRHLKDSSFTSISEGEMGYPMLPDEALAKRQNNIERQEFVGRGFGPGAQNSSLVSYQIGGSN